MKGKLRFESCLMSIKDRVQAYRSVLEALFDTHTARPPGNPALPSGVNSHALALKPTAACRVFPIINSVTSSGGYSNLKAVESGSAHLEQSVGAAKIKPCSVPWWHVHAASCMSPAKGGGGRAGPAPTAWK